MKKIGGAVVIGESDPAEEAEQHARAIAEQSEQQLKAILNAVAGMDAEQKVEWLIGNVMDMARQVNGILAVLPGIGAGLDSLFGWQHHMQEWETSVNGQLLLGSKRGN
jgi:hypothetical protein